jgi:hypothetical protein
MELGLWLDDACADYQGSWAAVDCELHDLCRRKGHASFEDVYTKVAIINRVYMAGISRIVRHEKFKADPEAAVVRGLAGIASDIESSLGKLTSISDLTAETMSTIVDVHGAITQDLSEQLGGANLRSFVSKYLHFHCPFVPIYDSLAASAITKVLAPFVERWAEPKDILPRPEHADATYYWYAARFLQLWELARAAKPDATVKMIDHGLWAYQSTAMALPWCSLDIAFHQSGLVDL